MSYPFPTFVFGIIGLVVFGLLALITFSYRDVANRHEHKSGNSQAHH
jgi:heme/copper-type cytochrome/quinol oxidase subunit 2